MAIHIGRREAIAALADLGWIDEYRARAFNGAISLPTRKELMKMARFACSIVESERWRMRKC